MLAGANPGAYIDSILSHSVDDGDEEIEEAIIYSGENITMYHGDEQAATDYSEDIPMDQGLVEMTPEGYQQEYIQTEEPPANYYVEEPVFAHADGSGEERPMAGADTRTVKDIFDTLNEDQKNVVYLLIDEALDETHDIVENLLQIFISRHVLHLLL